MIFDTGWKIIAKSALHRGFRKMQNEKNAQTTAKKPKWNFGPNPKSGG
jgi:hypothetical protein